MNRTTIRFGLKGHFSITPTDGRVYIESEEDEVDILEMLNSLLFSLKEIAENSEN